MVFTKTLFLYKPTSIPLVVRLRVVNHDQVRQVRRDHCQVLEHLVVGILLAVLHFFKSKVFYLSVESLLNYVGGVNEAQNLLRVISVARREQVHVRDLVQLLQEVFQVRSLIHEYAVFDFEVLEMLGWMRGLAHAVNQGVVKVQNYLKLFAILQHLLETHFISSSLLDKLLILSALRTTL